MVQLMIGLSIGFPAGLLAVVVILAIRQRARNEPKD
jgi:hypothetical protein